VRDKELQLDFATAQKNFIKAVDKGLLKVMSKMGISTLTSYKGAQLFEAIGLDEELIRQYFGQTTLQNRRSDADRTQQGTSRGA